jgi:hypothetical protein
LGRTKCSSRFVILTGVLRDCFVFNIAQIFEIK